MPEHAPEERAAMHLMILNGPNLNLLDLDSLEHIDQNVCNGLCDFDFSFCCNKSAEGFDEHVDGHQCAERQPAVRRVAGCVTEPRVSGMRAQTEASPTAPAPASIRNATVVPKRSAA